MKDPFKIVSWTIVILVGIMVGVGIIAKKSHIDPSTITTTGTNTKIAEVQKPAALQLSEAMACNRLIKPVDYTAMIRKQDEEKKRREEEERKRLEERHQPQTVRDMRIGDVGRIGYVDSYGGRLYVNRDTILTHDWARIRIKRTAEGVVVDCDDLSLGTVYQMEGTVSDFYIAVVATIRFK